MPTAQSNMVADAWRNGYTLNPDGERVPFDRQINWDALYQANYLANMQQEGLPYSERKGSVYVFENRVSNQFQFHLNSNINHRINDQMSLQGGIQAQLHLGRLLQDSARPPRRRVLARYRHVCRT